MAEKIVQTAGRDQLGEFAPMFAHLNDDILFGEVWNEEAIDVKTKCIITVVSLMASGITDSSLTYHLQNAKAHGVSKEEIAAIITHATMYVGWPKGWAVFRLTKHDMIIRPCAEGNDLAAYGADCCGCMTVKIFETALNAGLDVPKRSRNQRNNECACLLGTDIGAYDTCGHLCRYCYANANAVLVRENMKKHNPKSPFLIGNSLPGDVIHEAELKSWLDMQMRLEI